MNAQAPPEAAHVLLVEDDDGIRALVTRILRESGYRVTGCRSGADMWSLQPDLAVDLVLLDVMLPGVSGFDLLRALRAKGTVPVIMLSARNEEADRVLGLELGADDYVAKPFGRPELLARIRAVLRRASIAPLPAAAARPEALAFAGWRLDLRTRGREATRPCARGRAETTAGRPRHRGEGPLLQPFRDRLGRARAGASRRDDRPRAPEPA